MHPFTNFGLAALLCGAASFAQDSDREKELKAELSAKGLQATSRGVRLVAEQDFTSRIDELKKQHGLITKARKSYDDAQRGYRIAEAYIRKLEREEVGLNEQLARVRPGDVTANNRLVGKINAIRGQVSLRAKRLGTVKASVDRARAALNQLSEAYVDSVMETRKSADSVGQLYDDLKDDREVSKLVDEWGKLKDKAFELKPSTTFRSRMNDLEKRESLVLREAIPLRAEGRTFFVSVSVNGNAAEMVLDSGASLISLPAGTATELGIRLKASDPKIALRLADGRLISATQTKLKSVRVGKFTVENVDCAVLGPEATEAEPLLGMSFLQNFTFEVNAARSELTMVRVGESTTRRRSRR